MEALLRLLGGEAAATEWLAVGGLVAARVGPLTVLAPWLSLKRTPPVIRGALVLALTLALTPLALPGAREAVMAMGGLTYGAAVDIAARPRSTGSVLKPLLYGSMLDAGQLLPGTLVSDLPTNYGGYSPENFDREYRGAVPAHEALARSLNVPAVRMLRPGSQWTGFGIGRMAFPMLVQSWLCWAPYLAPTETRSTTGILRTPPDIDCHLAN